MELRSFMHGMCALAPHCRYPVSEQEELAAYLGKAELHLIDSPEGHDGFLLEQARIAPLVNKFLSRMELAHKADMLQEELSALKARL